MGVGNTLGRGSWARPLKLPRGLSSVCPRALPTRSLLLPFPDPAHVSAALVEKDFIYQPLEPDSFLFRFFF